MRNYNIVIASLFISSISIAQDIEAPVNVMALVQAAEVKYELPKGLLKAIVMVESGGRHTAKNMNDGNSAQKEAGLVVHSLGLMQIQLDAAHVIQRIKAKRDGVVLINHAQKIPTNKPYEHYLTAKELMRPEVNVDYGAAYLSWLLKNSKGDLAQALTCWNVGPGSKLCKEKIYYGRYVGKVLNQLVKQ